MFRKRDLNLSVKTIGLVEKLASDQKKVFNHEKLLNIDRNNYLKFKKEYFATEEGIKMLQASRKKEINFK